MSKSKNYDWYKDKIKNLKEEKKESYNDLKKYGRENSSKRKDRKKIKEGFKALYRSIKRAEKQNCEKEIQDKITEHENFISNVENHPCSLDD